MCLIKKNPNNKKENNNKELPVSSSVKILGVTITFNPK